MEFLLTYFVIGLFLLQFGQYVKGQQFVYTGPADTQYIPTYQPFDSYLPQRDLQTSHLPYHLQQTLPQYRPTVSSVSYNPYRFQSSQPAPFRSNHIVASTHRPNYSHLFSHIHQKNPTQDEAFLGEITLQNPIESPSPQERVEGSQDFLNHRTRIFAPDGGTRETSSAQVKNYFVNQKGDVYGGESNQKLVPNFTTLTNEKSRGTIPKQIDLLLEEPIKEHQSNLEENDDMVEVVQSKETTEKNVLSKKMNQDISDTDYEDDSTKSSELNEYDEENIHEDDIIYDDDEIPEEDVHDEDNVHEENIKDKNDVEEDIHDENNIIQDMILTTLAPPTTTLVLENQTTNALPTTAEAPEEVTDTWVVVASVQTSRSVSGARYLPSPKFEQDERVKLLNEEEQTTVEEEITTLVPSTIRQKTSTESLIDKLDRVQSDLSSGLLSGGFEKEQHNNIAVINESNMTDRMATTIMNLEAEVTTIEPVSGVKPLVQIRKFSPLARPPRLKNKLPSTKSGSGQRSQNDVPPNVVNPVNISALLPSGYKKQLEEGHKSNLLKDILEKAKLQQEAEKNRTLIETIKTSTVASQTTTVKDNSTMKLSLNNTYLSNSVSTTVTPEFVNETTLIIPIAKNDHKTSKIQIVPKIIDDVSVFLPPGYKSEISSSTSTTRKPTKKRVDLFNEAKPVDINAFLPPGYKPRPNFSKPSNAATEKVPTSLLPPGFKYRASSIQETLITTPTPTTARSYTPTTAKSFKPVLPKRPGGTRKSPSRLTTSRAAISEEIKVTAPTIQKGWPSRATTEFTGWPTPSTTPVSIEKLLEAARAAAASSTEPSETESSTTVRSTTISTPTTTTTKLTTPGLCVGECDLAGTIKLVAGVKWVPELLDRNTKEWQLLANEVQIQLQNVYSRSKQLNTWYKKIRIDGFSEGSVLVDYLVELNDLGRRIDTIEIKRLFHESLNNVAATDQKREGKALNETTKEPQQSGEEKFAFGNFIVDPKYTDFIVLPKQMYPTVGYAEDNVLLPQWAIAVIVIGLASLLFVIIFGVTVLVNRQKNAKKKTPTPLTDDMLNELNKNHMGGLDNYGAEDLYNMEDVWNDRAYEQKIPKKRSSGSIHDNSMSNLYDSWRSEWNGYYYNAYYGNNPGSSHSGYGGRRRPDYDTNF